MGNSYVTGYIIVNGGEHVYGEYSASENYMNIVFRRHEVEVAEISPW